MSNDNPHTSATHPSSVPPISSRSSGPLIIAGLVVLLLILHQDNWFWTDGTLMFGFIPIGLLWHALISLGACLTWALATRIAWPVSEELMPVRDQATSHRGGDQE
jgi:hypothetical protein